MAFAGLDTEINARQVAAVKRAAARGFRDGDEDTPHAEPWAGLRPMTADGMPMVGRLHGMLGLTLARG